MKTILISGGSGFLGFNLIKWILKQNENENENENENNRRFIKLIVIDNNITGNENRMMQFMDNELLYDTIDFYSEDICNDALFTQIKRKYKSINEIYHFASIASPKFYKRFPLKTLDVGYIGTKNLLNLALYYKTNGIDCKILFASTSEVYGDPAISPQNEEYYGNVNSYGTRSCYDESKRVGESLFYTYNQIYNLNTRIVRIFNTYGPYMDLYDGRIVTETIRCMLTGDTLAIYGDGKQTRSLNYVDDTIKMIVGVMNSDETTPINVGNNNEITVNEIAKTISKVCNEKIDDTLSLSINYTEIDKDDPKIRKPCLLKNFSILGDHTFTPLETGLYKTFYYFYTNN